MAGSSGILLKSLDTTTLHIHGGLSWLEVEPTLHSDVLNVADGKYGTSASHQLEVGDKLHIPDDGEDLLTCSDG